MSLVVNGVTVPIDVENAFSFNGSNIETVVCNGVTVWEQDLYKIFQYGINGYGLSHYFPSEIVIVPAPLPAEYFQLGSTLIGANDRDGVWTKMDLSSYLDNYADREVRLILKYTNATSYRGDIQVDDFTVGSTSWNFDALGEAELLEANATGTDSQDYDSISFSPVTNNVLAETWGRDSGGTSSSSTGSKAGNTGSYYLYVETSSPRTTASTAWLRTPVVTLDSTVCEFYYSRYGTSMGDLTIYLEVLAQ